MRTVAAVAAGVLVMGLTACSESGPDNVNGDAPPVTGPTAAQETPAPAKTPKHKKKARPTPTPEATVVPTPPPPVPLPSGEEFDPKNYDPEGDHDPNATPEASGFPAG